MPVSPLGLAVAQVAPHVWFLRARSDDPSRNRRLAYREDYIRKRMLTTGKCTDEPRRTSGDEPDAKV